MPPQDTTGTGAIPPVQEPPVPPTEHDLPADLTPAPEVPQEPAQQPAEATDQIAAPSNDAELNGLLDLQTASKENAPLTPAPDPAQGTKEKATGHPGYTHIVDSLSNGRRQIKNVAEWVKGLKVHPFFYSMETAKPGVDSNEIIANIILSYRHLEDAAMRLGKALQAYDGGTSVYDK